MLRILGILCFTLFACGTDFGVQEHFECSVQGMKITTDSAISFRGLERNVLIAWDILVKNEIVPVDKLQKLFEETILHVGANPCLEADSEETGHCHIGRSYFGSPDVFVGVTFYGFLHEMMHRWDDHYLGSSLTSQWHWTRNEVRHTAELEWETRYSKLATLQVNPSETIAECGDLRWK